MMQAPENRGRDDAPVALRYARPGGRMAVQGSVGSRLVVIGDELVTDPPQAPFVERNDLIQALPAEGADPAFGDGVRLGRPDRRQDRLDAQALRSRDELTPVRAIPVPKRYHGRWFHAVASIIGCHVQAAVGWALTLTCSIRRLACEMTKNTYKVRNISAGTVQKSAAQITSRWLRRKVRLQRRYLNSVSLTIAGGTSEIQRNIIVTRGLGLPRS